MDRLKKRPPYPPKNEWGRLFARRIATSAVRPCPPCWPLLRGVMVSMVGKWGNMGCTGTGARRHRDRGARRHGSMGAWVQTVEPVFSWPRQATRVGFARVDVSPLLKKRRWEGGVALLVSYVFNACILFSMRVSYVFNVCILCFQCAYPLFQCVSPMFSMRVSYVFSACILCFQCVYPMFSMRVSSVSMRVSYVFNLCIRCFQRVYPVFSMRVSYFQCVYPMFSMHVSDVFDCVYPIFSIRASYVFNEYY
jgi:hypothetical protein